ncbi:DNA -binding domain-containing protein [Sinorhizobium chiapasense]|uniref:DUF2285 domain-containing protein n=1 Tax=Sinorhizobium chiapasense TaxID=501572 RepID=A0ABZ2BFU5_9HYPH
MVVRMLFDKERSLNKPFREEGPPLTQRVNAHDEAHVATYLRLLDADAEGADWREAVRIIFGIDPDADPARAKRIHETHLSRARRMTQVGYRHLLHPRMQ